MLLRNLVTRENDCTNGKTRTLQKQAVRKVLVYRPIFERYQGWVALGAAFGILQGLLSASASVDYVSGSTMAKTHAALTLPAGVIGFLAAPKMGEIYHVPPKHRSGATLPGETEATRDHTGSGSEDHFTSKETGPEFLRW